MVKLDEDALVCDLAETYGIFDYRQLPAYQVAVFSLGLKDNSRIMQALSGQKHPLETMLLSGILDRLSLLAWFKTSDGQKGRNRPVSITEHLTQGVAEKEEMSFASGEDFDVYRRALLEELGGDD